MSSSKAMKANRSKDPDSSEPQPLECETSTALVRPVASTATWNAVVAMYQEPHAGKATWQIINTIGSFLALWFLI
jgi:hypothetical protein